LLPVLGTAKTIAPEQARGSKLDQRTDVYQMGTLMYEALAGRAPFEGETAIDVVAQHLTTAPEPPSAHARKGWVTEALDELVLKALAKDPTDRFKSVEDLQRALENVGAKPTATKPLDEAAFGEARRSLVDMPTDATWAEALEDMGNESGAWSRVAEALSEGANAAADADAKLSLLSRVSRIYDDELKEATRAEAAYQQILELDPGNDEALRGLESARRSAGDHEGVLELLLDRVESEEDAEARQALLREVAGIYDKELGDAENACIAYTQALVADPNDAKAAKEVERLAGSDQARWGEVLEMLNQATQEAQAVLFTDDDEQAAAARQQVEAAQAQYDEFKAAIDQNITARREQSDVAAAEVEQQIAAAEEALEVEREQLPALEEALSTAAQALGETTEAAEAKAKESEAAHAAAEAKVEEYESVEQEAGEAPSEEQAQKLDTLAGEAETLVEQAGELEAAAEEAAAGLEAARLQMESAQQALDAIQTQIADMEVAVDEQKGRAAVGEGDAGDLTPEERESLDAALAQLDAAQKAAAAFEDRDDDEVAVQRERDLADLADIYVLMGRWYGDRINRADFALSCFSQALTLDEQHEAAYDGVLDLYRGAQSWNELAATLLQRADRETSPVKAREYRAEAAVVFTSKLGDGGQARAQLERVLEEDPAHPIAQAALADLVREQQDFPALVKALEAQLESLKGEERGPVLMELAELYEGQLEDLAKAQERYSEALELDARNLDALKGLERCFGRNEDFEGLLENLRAQVELAPTPRQRIGLLERVGMLLEEEFVNHADAAQAFEEIIAIDAAYQPANEALARLYRHLQRFEDVVEALDRNAGAEANEDRRIELMLHAARTLSVDIGSPDRAMDMYEEVLAINELQPEALSELARLKSVSGDAQSAVEAVERLAEQEQDAQKQSRLWIRAGNLLVEAGDRDSAVVRYRKALDLDKLASEAAEALREIYDQRGDARGATDMLIHAIEIADGDLKRASLLAELGVAFRDQLDEEGEAKIAFEEAMALDPTSTIAAAGLAGLAFDAGENQEGVQYFEEVAGRLGDLPVEGAAALCIAAGEAYKVLDDGEKSIDAYKRARDLQSDDLGAAERHAQVVMEAEDFGAAERLYERILAKFDDQLEVGDRSRLLLALGEAQLGNKHSKRAIDTFQQIIDARPEDPAALEALTRAHEAARNWTEVVNLLQLRSRRTSDEDEMFRLLVQTGDVFLEKVRDRDAASQTYVMALDVKPDNRNLLTKLMGVYSDAHDWPRLIEVILRISEMVKDDAQLAKYFNTAASIAHMELGRFDEAANYYEEALSHMVPGDGDAQFEGLVACLTENQDWERLERAYESRIARMREAEGEPDNMRIATLLDARAEIIQNRLGRLVDALTLYEEALSLDGENEERRAMLTQIYTKEPKRFFEHAVDAH
ncbi:MAG: hypothetical protein OXT09_27575, partial [Myxococcales bacterium]|nr:hypothetical protein [Myxococcales bacterium]